MIISASRRTDIPAFYSDWFFNRVREGFVLVRNPMNYHQISKININPDVVDCIVFWTKNPYKLMKNLDKLNQYNYYFQFTLNPYDQSIECNVPKKSFVIETFIELSKRIGKEKVIWRYDPILLTDKIDKGYHYTFFEYLAKKLSGYTEKCTISFIDLYKKTERNLRDNCVKLITRDDMIEIASKFAEIGAKYNLALETCSEEIDLASLKIEHAKCIDNRLISRILGVKLDIDKDKNQREVCGCVASVDIGAYNTCNHNCSYCYANFNKGIVEKNKCLHNPNSPLILGNIDEGDKITDREVKSFINPQTSLF